MKKALLLLLLIALTFVLPRNLSAQKIPMQTDTSGKYTQPVIWPGGPGCVHRWVSENTSIGIEAGIGNIPAFIIRNISHDDIYVKVGDNPTDLPARAYIPSQISNKVAVIDLTKDSVIAKIDVGRKPYGVAISHNGIRVYITNYTDGTVSVIDALNNTIIRTITVGKNPEGIAVSPDDAAVYVANSGEATVSIIDATTNMVTSSITTNANPVDVMTSKDGSQLYVPYGNSTKLDVIKLQTHNPIGANLTPGPVRAMVLSGDGNTLYTLDPGANQVYNSINTITNAATPYNVGAGLNGIALNASGSALYLTSGGANQLSVINTATNALTKQYTVGSNPNAVAVAPGGLVYVINGDSNDITVIDALAGTVVHTFKTGDLQLFAHGNFIRGTTCDAVPESPPDTIYHVYPSPPTILTKGTPGHLTTHADDPSPSTSFIVYAWNLNNGITITAPAGYEVSADNITFTKTITVGYKDNIIETPVYVRLAEGNAVGTNNGNILMTSDQAPDVLVPVTGTIVEPISNIKTGVLTGHIAFCTGNPSASPAIEQFKVNGTLLTGDITLTAPANFEISLSPTNGYGTTLTLKNTTGTISNVEIYVRSAATALGDITGDIRLTSAWATDRTVTVTGSVFPVPTADQIPDMVVQGGMTTTAINFTGTGNTYDWINNDNLPIGLASGGSGGIAPFRAINNTIADLVANVTVIPKNAALAYVANQGNNKVSVINTVSGQVVGSIPVDKNPYAVTVTRDASKVFIANQGSSPASISVINTISGAVINTLPSGPNPLGLAVSPDGGRLYVTNGSTNSVTVINLSSGLTLANIAVGTKPQGIAVNADGSMIYVANRTDNTVSVINAASLQVIATPKVGTNPEYIAISPDGNWIYVTNYTGKTVSIISAANNTVSGTIDVKYSPSLLALSPDGNTMYVTSGGANNLIVVNLVNNSIVTTITTGVSPEGVSVTPDGLQVFVANYGSNSISVISTATNQITRTIGLPGPPVSFGNFIVAGTGCPGVPMSFKITVKPGTPHILTSGTLTALTTVYGTPSASASFKVSAIDISANVLVTPPASFEVSLDNITFSKTVSIHTTSTDIPSTPVYIRLSATAQGGSYNGDIILSSADVPSATEPTATSTVTPAPLTITADDKERILDKPNPVFTATYKGFVNNETAKQLVTASFLTTTATASSPKGKYPIMASGAVSPNYTFTYVDGVLTIKRTQNIFIPNAFTPNGDGVNDTWLIKDLDDYPTATVSVFNRSGQTLFYLSNYAKAWDGTYNGKNLATGVYYYVIDLHTGDKPLSGYVAIIR